MQDRQESVPVNEQACRHPAGSDKCVTRFVLNRNGYDPFIDFLKGVCILLVVLAHCFPQKLREFSLFPIWGDPAVPIFLIIQVFHTYKKGVENVAPNYAKLWQRIIKPFILMETIIILVSFLRIMLIGNHDTIKLIKGIISGGGMGPGSYYPWLYVQFAIILAFIVPVFRKIKGMWLAIIFVLIAECIEIFCSIINLWEPLYRLMFLRYTFLIYLGYLLVFKGYTHSWFTGLLSVISIMFTLFFAYTDISLSPYIHDTDWRGCHWMCYFYIAYLMLYLLKRIYCKLGKYESIVEYFKKMGQYSYEVFLFQMFYFAVFHGVVIKVLNLVGGKYLAHSIAIPFAVIVCIVPVIWYKTANTHFKES